MDDAPASGSGSAPPPEPYGIKPYVERARDRIETHFRTGSREPAQRPAAFVVGVFGEWGSGKSTVLNAIGAHYDNTPKALVAEGTTAVRPEVTLRIDFNAWRYEREEHLLVPLLKTIERTLNSYVDELEKLNRKEAGAVASAARKMFDKSTWQWLGDRAQLLGACTIALTRMIKIKAGVPGFGEVELDPEAALRAAQEQIDRATKLGQEKKEQQDKAQTPERPLESLYYDLYTHLQRLTRGVDAHDRGRLNFVFLIDDLDRCLPEKSVEMLEAIKLFLDIDGCAFVLALDDEVIERGIAHRYRDYLAPPGGRNGADANDQRAAAPPITGHEYLEKIVQLPFRLPRWSKREVRAFVSSRFKEETARWSGLPTDPLASTRTLPTPDPWLIDLIVDGVPPVPRNLVRAIELLEFMRDVAIKRGLGERLQAYPVAQMVMLQLFAPACFRFLRRGHAEGWKTFERRLRKDSSEFSTAPQPVLDALARQPPVSSEEFFDWWVEFCRVRMKDPAADPYIGRTELPLARLLSESRNNRSGFDPRNLFLLARSTLEIDAGLEPYFSLFLEAAPTAAAGTAPAAPVPVFPTVTAEHVAVAAPAAGSAPLVTSTERTEAGALSSVTTAAPRDPEVFVRQLLSRSQESWRNAISREEHLIGHTLEERTLNELLQREKELRQPQDPPRESGWLEAIAPLLTPVQMLRFLEETQFLRQWAVRANLIGEAHNAAGQVVGITGSKLLEGAAAHVVGSALSLAVDPAAKQVAS